MTTPTTPAASSGSWSWSRTPSWSRTGSARCGWGRGGRSRWSGCTPSAFGDQIHVGDRALRAVAPPLYDSPTSIGVFDQSTGSLFSVDAFGAILPEPTQDASEVPPEALAGGRLGWATSDSPWAHVVDRERFGQVLNRVRQLQPTRIFSSHLPAASGTSLEAFLAVRGTVPGAEPLCPQTPTSSPRCSRPRPQSNAT